MDSANDDAERPDRPSRSETLNALRDDGDDSTPRHHRRRFLKGVASGAAALGMTGTAAALDPTGSVELDLAERPFRTRDAQVAAVEEHAQDLLAVLADRGYVDRADAADLDWRTSAWRVDGTATARIDAERRLDGGVLRISVEPQNGRAYAVDTTGDQWTLFEPATDSVAEPMDCTITTRCLDGFNCYNCEETGVCCTDGGCHVGGGTGNCCSSCDSFCGC